MVERERRLSDLPTYKFDNFFSDFISWHESGIICFLLLRYSISFFSGKQWHFRISRYLGYLGTYMGAVLKVDPSRLQQKPVILQRMPQKAIGELEESSRSTTNAGLGKPTDPTVCKGLSWPTTDSPPPPSVLERLLKVSRYNLFFDSHT